jgi:ABC-2 type transport system ATP-binding protein
MSLGHAAERPLRTYSRGMQQRTCLARAMLHRPEFLVLDEPTLGLDPVGLNEMRTILLDLNRSGVALLFSSHQLAEMERIAHRVVLMTGGRVVATGPTREVVGGLGAAEAEAEVERVTPAVLAALRALPFVVEVTPASERGLVIGLDPAAGPAGADLRVPLSATIAASGGVVLSVAYRQPTLEDAFLRLTTEADGQGQPAQGRVVRMERRAGDGDRAETTIARRRLGAA